jgi:TolB protein
MLLILGMGMAHADLTIEITKGVEGALPIAVVPFGSRVPAPEDMAAIIGGDLQRSGRFQLLSPQRHPGRPTEISQVNFPAWRASRTDHIVVGSVKPGPGGGYVVTFQLLDVLSGQQVLSSTFNAESGQLRQLAHQISDLIYLKLTGEQGPFSTRIAYVNAVRQAGGGSFTLVVADSDGYNPKMVVRSQRPIMSPTWSPTGERLAYVSFEGGKPQVVVQNLRTGRRRVVSAHPGINGAPAWSPDGGRLALTLSKDGNPEIYVYNLAGGSLTRLTNNSAIDTEPAWSPNGDRIVFTSDRGGNPQLYLINAAGGEAGRLTFEGQYNSRADFSPDGSYLTMVHGQGGKYRIAILELQSRRLRVLTQGDLDESPSFAPNGRMIIYAATQQGAGVLAAVSVDGRVRQQLFSRNADVREPKWSPYIQ